MPRGKMANAPGEPDPFSLRDPRDLGLFRLLQRRGWVEGKFRVFRQPGGIPARSEPLARAAVGAAASFLGAFSSLEDRMAGGFELFIDSGARFRFRLTGSGGETAVLSMPFAGAGMGLVVDFTVEPAALRTTGHRSAGALSPRPETPTI
jgi:hypothetical protein